MKGKVPVRKKSPKMQMRPIEDVARSIGIRKKYLELYGLYKAKISLDILASIKKKKRGKYILITSITPTHLGEGKTVTCVGLSMALNRMKKKAASCISQPSIEDVFGIRGPGTGAGLSQIFPGEEANLHLTGDSSAVLTAQNLCAAYLDNSIFYANHLNIDTNSIRLKRIINANDRSLRVVNIGMGSKTDGVSRKTAFESTPASEVMAILALAGGMKDLRKRLGRIIVGFTKKGKPVTCDDLKVAGSMSVLLRDAIKPNILQTSEGTPCFVHTGSAGNSALGASSILSDTIALGLCDYTVTETAFGADLGAEKFFNIKCRASGMVPDVSVLVCSMRALKMHSGDYEIAEDKPLPKEFYRENVSAVERGLSNLEKQIENLQVFGVPIVVCINRFKEDTDKEINAVKRRALNSGAHSIAVSSARMQGGEGAMELAQAVIEACKAKRTFRFLYPLDIALKDKIRRIAKTIYGAKEVVFSESANQKALHLKKQKLDNLPICMDKTHLSLSPSAKRKARPHGFKFPVDDLDIQNGAGYIKAVASDGTTTLPGLPKKPRGTEIDIDEEERTLGLF